MSVWYEAKQFLQHFAGISMDALHILAGVVGFIIFAMLLRRPLSSWLPWLLVLAVTLVNEALDLWLEQWPSPGMQYGESARDMVLTMLLPTLLLVSVRRLPRLFTSLTEVPRPQEQKLLLISANSAWNVINFRMELVRALQEAGYRVAVAAPAAEEARALERAGVLFVPLAMSPSGTSPLHDAALLARYCQLMRKLKPAAYLGFTAKPNVYGSLAARACGVPSINNITGLGTAFIHGSTLERLVSSLYRLALRRSDAVFFHNPDDRDLFVNRGLVAPDRTAVIPGSGVDLGRFAPAPSTGGGSAPKFLFVGRLLWEKGVREFAEAAMAVKQDHPYARFQILGSFADDGRAVPKALMDQWQGDGVIEYLGTCADVRPHIKAADCIVLPSYREGLPRVVLEAAAMGRPAIVSDVPGCRHAVVDGATGYLCAVGSSDSLAQALIRMIRLSQAERQAMGLKARARAEEHFGPDRVWAEYLLALSRIGQRS